MSFRINAFLVTIILVLSFAAYGCGSVQREQSVNAEHGHSVWIEETATKKYKYKIEIQPIRVTNDDGSLSASHLDCKTLEKQTQAIFDQVNIQVILLPLKTYARTVMYAGVFGSDHNVEDEIGKAPIPADNTIPTVFFVKSIHPDGSGGAMGLIGGRFMFLGEVAFKKSRIHVLAHELGHNLGLGHSDFGATESKYTMMSGEPAIDYANVYPNGKRRNYLTKLQHAEILKSPFVKFLDPLRTTGSAE